MFSLSPPIPINRNYYRCDKSFQLDYIKELFHNDKPYYGLAILNARDSSFWIGSDLEIKKVKVLSLTVTNSHQKGGQSQGRFDRIFQNKRDRNDGYVIEELLKAFYDFETNSLKKNITGLILGGSAETRGRIMADSDFKVLTDHVIGSYALADMNVHTLWDLSSSDRQNFRLKDDQIKVAEIEHLLEVNPNILDFGLHEVLDGLQKHLYQKVYLDKPGLECLGKVDELYPECQFIIFGECSNSTKETSSKKDIKTGKAESAQRAERAEKARDNTWISRYGGYIGVKFF